MPHKKIPSGLRRAAFLFFFGIAAMTGQLSVVPADAQPLTREREIQPRKPFSPSPPGTIATAFRKINGVIEAGMENIPECFPVARDFPGSPEFRLPEGRTETPDPERAEIPPISRQPDNRVSLKEEMVTLEDLDIGKTGGMVCHQNSKMKPFQGYLSIPAVWVEDFIQPYPIQGL
jgi:hypothetical protein